MQLGSSVIGQSLLAAGFAVATLIGFCPQSMAVITWSRVACYARQRAAHNDFDAAVVGYKKAIELAASERNVPDVTLNLKLCLAETYRKAHRLKECQSVLNSMTPQVMAHTKGDPLLPARFWGRKAELDWELGLRMESSAASRRSFAISTRHLGHTYEYKRKLTEHLHILSLNQDADSILELIQDIWERDRELLEQNGAVRVRFNEGCDLLCKEAAKRTQEKKLEQAASMLHVLSNVGYNKGLVVSEWLTWLETCYLNNRTALIPHAVQDVSVMISKVDETQPAVPKLTLLKASYFLTWAHCHDPAAAPAVKEWNRLRMLYEGCDEQTKAEGLPIRLTASFRIAERSNRDPEDALAPPMQEIWRNEVAFTKDLRGKNPFGLVENLHCASRRMLCLGLFKQHKLDEARAILLSVNPKALRAQSQAAISDTSVQHAILAVELDKVGRRDDAIREWTRAKELCRWLHPKEREACMARLVSFGQGLKLPTIEFVSTGMGAHRQDIPTLPAEKGPQK